jgi:hypothetical protein
MPKHIILTNKSVYNMPIVGIMVLSIGAANWIKKFSSAKKTIIEVQIWRKKAELPLLE